jgi:hypothetical protein
MPPVVVEMVCRIASWLAAAAIAVASTAFAGSSSVMVGCRVAAVLRTTTVTFWPGSMFRMKLSVSSAKLIAPAALGS